jgi:hypothetical protein
VYILRLAIVFLYLVLFATQLGYRIILNIALIFRGISRLYKDSLNAFSPRFAALLVLVFLRIFELNSNRLQSGRESYKYYLDIPLAIFCDLQRLLWSFFCFWFRFFTPIILLASLAKRFNLLSQFLDFIRLELASLPC